jgi:hypothetical protein
MLVAEEDDAALVVSPLNLAKGDISYRLGEINAADLGTEGCTGRDNLDRHRILLTLRRTQTPQKLDPPSSVWPFMPLSDISL